MLDRDSPTCLELQGACRRILELVGEDPDRQGLVKTPERMARAYDYLTSGYRMDPAAIIKGALFDESSEEIVLVKNIEFYSLCEHHFLPFFGKAHVAYIPNGRVVGISKLARVVEVFSRRLQVQERLTHQVASCLWENLGPLGVAVIMDAHHMCMMMRGVEKQASSTVTSAMLGTFRNNPSTRQEFMTLVDL
ncbi:MAG: GTP cyclohydrolase I FolE [Candidatus Eremiobacterota bacterium]